jgi:iron complex transport system ATP-binding protein
MTPRLCLQHVSCRIGDARILTDVSFHAGVGEMVALLGRNGAGKSTALDVAAGLRPIDGGAVSLEARRLAEWTARDRARLVAHLPQAVRPDLPLTAEQLVLMGRYPHTDRWFEADDDRAAVEQAMRGTACWVLRRRVMATLSGGERQRVLLAACLAQQAPLLLVDEPSTFLDIDQQLQCFSLLRQDCDAGGTCVAVTHDLNLALAFATRLVILEAGRVVIDLTVAEAVHDDDWLTCLSPRLRLGTNAAGRPWVSYA